MHTNRVSCTSDDQLRSQPQVGAGTILLCMNDDEPHDEKKVTAATTDAPQEEFISPEPPSKPDPNAGQKSGVKKAPPRE